MRRTFAIGDIQGCLAPLKKLLHAIEYNPRYDILWFAGDLVNRGPQSLETLRFIQSLPESTVCVLGNHDLALIAAHYGILPIPNPTFSEILQAPDKVSLLHWLQSRPVLHHDAALGFTLTHAGIFPAWDLGLAQSLAAELENVLQTSLAEDFFHYMYGNHPVAWHDSLSGWERLRFITNAFTRMRFCTPEGQLNLTAKGSPEQHPELIPWFAIPHRPAEQDRLIFGHWAALGNKVGESINLYPLDTGCVWGHCLTAFCLQTHQYTAVDCT